MILGYARKCKYRDEDFQQGYKAIVASLHTESEDKYLHNTW